MVVIANLETASPLGEAVDDAAGDRRVACNLPAEYRYEFIGRAKMLAESSINFLIAFGLSASSSCT